jgi:hypothetical protein
VAGVNLTVVRSGHRSVVIGNGLYALGGTGSSGVSASVERAPIAGDGSLAPFAPIPGGPLSTPRTGLAIATIGNSLYIIGGSNGGGPLRTVEHASVNADGAVGSPATSDVALIASRALHTSTVIRSFVYMIGKLGTENTIERAPISPDGSIGPFATVSGVALVAHRDGHTTAVIGNSVYVVGGEAGGNQLSSVERATINADGSLGPFATVSGVNLNQQRFGHISVVLGDFLYVIGGYASGGRLTSVERAAINANGTIGPFATVTGVALNTGRNLFTGLVTGSYLYVMGGSGDSGAIDIVERSAIAADGSLGAFAPFAFLTSPRFAHASVIVGDAIHLIGGQSGNGHTTVGDRALISTDGSLSGFSPVSGVALATARAYHTATVVGNSLYVLGGDVDILHSVEHANLR